jgi:hypothetical protein
MTQAVLAHDLRRYDRPSLGLGQLTPRSQATRLPVYCLHFLARAVYTCKQARDSHASRTSASIRGAPRDGAHAQQIEHGLGWRKSVSRKEPAPTFVTPERPVRALNEDSPCATVNVTIEHHRVLVILRWY